MSGPRLALREARHGHRTVDLLFYDDVLAVVPHRVEVGAMDLWGLVAEFVTWIVLEPRLRRRRERREASPATLPRRTRILRLADVRTVEVRRLDYGAADLTIDGDTYFVGAATGYRPPWGEALGPVFGDRLKVVG